MVQLKLYFGQQSGKILYNHHRDLGVMGAHPTGEVKQFHVCEGGSVCGGGQSSTCVIRVLWT